MSHGIKIIKPLSCVCEINKKLNKYYEAEAQKAPGISRIRICMSKRE